MSAGPIPPRPSAPAPAPAPASPPPVGARIGPYRAEAVIGRGGMGVVLRARHEETGAYHALKVVTPDPRRTESRGDRLLARFAREREALARVADHPGVVRASTRAASTTARRVHAMDLVEGGSLAELLARRGKLDPLSAARIVGEAADAIAHAHAHGVVHRDIKPENVLIDASGRVRITDFGLAADSQADALTATGEMLGTPGYMAPEQAVGTDPDARAAPAVDVYGLGGLLYAALTGRAPIAGGNAHEVLMAIIRRDPTPPRALDPAIPEALDAICRRALRKEPAERQASAARFAEQLRAWELGETVASTAGASGAIRRIGRAAGRRRLVIGAAAVVAATLGATAVALRTQVTDAEVVARAERRLLGGERLDAEERARVRAIAADGSAPAGDRQRAAVMAALAEAPGAPAEQVAGALAVALRGSGAGVDVPLGRIAARALVAAGQSDALYRLVADDGLDLPIDDAVASELARHVVRGRLAPPEARFAALYRARGLDEEARGRLLLLRSRARRARGELDAALDDVVDAWRRHGLVDDGPWDAALRARALETVVARAADLAAAWAIDDALDRADGRVAPTPHPEVRARVVASVAELATGLLAMAMTPELDRGLGGMAFMVRWGYDPVAAVSAPEIATIRDVFEPVGDREASRPAGERNDLYLAVMAGAHAIHGREARARTWLRVIGKEAPRRWYEHLLLARVALTARDGELAIAHAEAALAAEGTAPGEGPPSDAVPLLVVQAHLLVGGDEHDLDRSAALLVDAADRARELKRQRAELDETAGDESEAVALTIPQLAIAIADADGEALLRARGRALGPAELLAQVERVPFPQHPWSLDRVGAAVLRAQAAHAQAHGDVREAAELFERAIARTQETEPGRRRRLRLVIDQLERRVATVRDAMPELAARDLREIERLRRDLESD